MNKENENENYKSIVQDYVVKNARKRKIINSLITAVLFSFVIIAVLPLVSILIDVFRNGVAAFNLDFLILPPGAMGSSEGGIGPAIQGTLMIVGFATVIGAPIGVLVGIYLSEYSSSEQTICLFS